MNKFETPSENHSFQRIPGKGLLLKTLVISFFCLLISCAPSASKLKSELIEPRIDLQQARSIALEFMKRKYQENEYKRDSVSIYESTSDFSHWEVSIKKSRKMMPPNYLILIDKITGDAKDESDKLE